MALVHVQVCIAPLTQMSFIKVSGISLKVLFFARNFLLIFLKDDN